MESKKGKLVKEVEEEEDKFYSHSVGVGGVEEVGG